MKRSILFLLVFLMSPLAAESIKAQTFPNQRDDSYPLLGLKRAKSTYERAQSEFQRIEELYKRNLVSLKDYENAKNSHDDAEVNYQQSLLVLLFENQFVSIADAVKYQDDKGKKRVKITLANTSEISAEFAQIINEEDEIFRSLQPDKIHNVYVSLSNESGAIVSSPYEVKIDILRAGKPATVDFELLQDLEEVQVDIIYGSGSSRSPKIFLRKDASANRVILQSNQFSQELELGNTATYGINLELFSGEEDTYKLEVLNLPRVLARNFTDASTQARLSQIKFTESTNTRNANLQITLPDRPSDEVKMDIPIAFYVLAVPRDKSLQVSERLSDTWTQQEIEELNIGYVRLELLPRGVGKPVVKAPQLFGNALPGNPVSFTFNVLNEGSRRLDNIEFEIETPLQWEKRIEPEIIEKLDIREEIPVTLTILPPAGQSIGKYEVRMRTTSLSDGQPVAADNKSFSVQIDAQNSMLGTILLVLTILGLLSGMVYFGIKLSRK